MRAVDLFAGAGGLALGLSKAGFDENTLVEWDEYACATIRSNVKRRIPGTERWCLLESNVAEVDYSTMTSEIDLLSAGLPCQPFSVAGKGRAHQDRRDMFSEVVRAASEIRPKAILIENVRGLLRPKFRDYFDYLLLALASPGRACMDTTDWKHSLNVIRRNLATGGPGHVAYTVYVHGINAADYGVPQWRERVLIVAFRDDLGISWSPFRPTHNLDNLLWRQWQTGEYWRRHGLVSQETPRMTKRVARRLAVLRNADEWPEPRLLPWVTVRDAICDLPAPLVAERDDILNHVLNPGARMYARHSGSTPDEPAKTLKAGSHGVPGGENTLRVRPDEVRYFSVRECARLQTFPDAYAFVGPWSRAMRQVGNAVPVELAQVVGTHIKLHLCRAEATGAKRDIRPEPAVISYATTSAD